MSIGSLKLTATPKDTQGEACLTLLSSTNPGQPVFQNFANIRVARQLTQNGSSSTALRKASGVSQSWAIVGQDESAMRKSSRASSMMAAAASQTVPSPGSSPTADYNGNHSLLQPVKLAVPAPSLDIAGQYKWLAEVVDPLHQKSRQQVWGELQQQTGWVDGQDSLQSIYSPLEIESDAESAFI
jgi:hypothetical protein